MGNIESLKTLTPLISYLANQINATLWVRNLDFSEQLFLSDSFEKIWGMDKKILFDNPESFYETLILDDLNSFREETSKRITNQYTPQTLVTSNAYYRIKRPNGDIFYIHDFNFILHDDANEPVAQCGISTKINAQQWKEKKYILPLQEIFAFNKT